MSTLGPSGKDPSWQVKRGSISTPSSGQQMQLEATRTTTGHWEIAAQNWEKKKIG